MAKKLTSLHGKAVSAFFDRVTEKAGEVQETDRVRLRHDIEAAIADFELSGYADAIYDEATVLVEAAWNDAKTLLDVSTGFDVVPVRTLEKIRDRINDLTFLVQEREQEALRTTLDNAFAEGLSGVDVAKQIREMFAAGYHRLNDKGEVVLIAPTKAWSEMVARTEMATAATAGAMDLYEEAGIKMLRWQASDPCDICAQYDDQVYPIDDLPDEPPVHNNCRCALVPDDEDLGSWRGTDEERALATTGNNA